MKLATCFVLFVKLKKDNLCIAAMRKIKDCPMFCCFFLLVIDSGNILFLFLLIICIFAVVYQNHAAATFSREGDNVCCS